MVRAEVDAHARNPYTATRRPGGGDGKRGGGLPAPGQRGGRSRTPAWPGGRRRASPPRRSRASRCGCA
ncbi:hypothetical protein L842_1686 [Mycobacterium intracellulare MIN_052511_1280]|nr:hypothetical protein L842_1686 [Mycobacterium intracellulare MIN_052511_1280]